MKILTIQQLKKYEGKFLDVYPLYYHLKDKKTGQYITCYELRSISKTIKENHQSVDEILNN